MSSVRRPDANIVNDDSLYGTSPPQTRFQSVFTPEEHRLITSNIERDRIMELNRFVNGPTQPRAQEGFYSENDRRSLKERRDAWLFGDSKVQAWIDKSDIIK